MTDYTLRVNTDNPDFKKRVVRAFDEVGLDLDEQDRPYQLSAYLIIGDGAGTVLWGTEYQPDDDNEHADSQVTREYVWREVTVHARVDDRLTQPEVEQLVESALNNEPDERLNHVEIFSAIVCQHCGKRIEEFRGHWWTGNDFMCPDGEQPHAPGINELLPEDDQAAIVITRGQLAAMTGRVLNPEFVARMDEIWPNSSIPEALAVIADSVADKCGAYSEWDDTEIEDHMLGSGATSYPWWTALRRQPDGTYHARLENPDRPEENASTTFTADDVRRARGEILAGEHGVNDTIRDALREDPDANAVDCLLQVLVLGEVTYG